jgi:hypothetical protein
MTVILEAIADIGWADFRQILFGVLPARFEMDALPVPE